MKPSIAGNSPAASRKRARNGHRGVGQVLEAVDEIVHELETSGREISTSAIGAKVLEKLREVDEVAYLRYASVHQRFEDVARFVDEIHALGQRVKPDARQPELFNEPANHGRV